LTAPRPGAHTPRLVPVPKFRERRVATRPREGDAESCPFCRTGLTRFHEPESPDTQPGWVCDNPTCGYHVLVRKPPAPTIAERRRSLVNRSASALRKSMSVRARIEGLRRRSERLNAAQPPRKK